VYRMRLFGLMKLNKPTEKLKVGFRTLLASPLYSAIPEDPNVSRGPTRHDTDAIDFGAELRRCEGPHLALMAAPPPPPAYQ
jgi:hypothetical protein